ncbi:putative N-methylcoclaurine 3'-monooxygenase [Helianthus annuus]|nr:putative N-methylcoclaurine 3'-monooxygenase [Helianthus annuus]
MNITNFLKDFNLPSPLFVLSTIPFLFFLVKQIKSLPSKCSKNLPPGPPKLPIIGNLHQVDNKPHVSTANIAREYGPLISLRLGNQLVVIASTPEAAMGILKTQDRFLSARVVPTAFQQPSLIPHSLIWSECNETWKNLRTLCRTEMFSTKALEAQSMLREEKIGHMLEFLHSKQGEAINVEDVVFTTLFNTLSSIIFAKDLIDLKDDYGGSNELKATLHKIIEFGGRVIDFGSFFPILERFDLHGIRKGTLKLFSKVFSYWEYIIDERRSQVNSSTWSSEQAHTFVDRLLENGFSNNQIHQLVTELFVAGTNTTTSIVVWVMSELVRHQEVMLKIDNEMKREIKSDKINSSHLSKLPYLQACIKEAMRLHPPVPLLLPHMATDTCEVMSYTIPKNTKVFVNLWAMGRDPNVWDDPFSFDPERFMVTKLDFKGQDFELLPFGSGRRMCPGLPSGIKSIEFILASLIHEFTWVLPDGVDPSKLNMDSKFGIAMKRETPLELIFKRK